MATAKKNFMRRTVETRTEVAEREATVKRMSGKLKGFRGSENWYRHGIGPMTYTDGVLYLAREAPAFWLLDVINAAYSEQEPLPVWDNLVSARFQLWMIEVYQNEEVSALIDPRARPCCVSCWTDTPPTPVTDQEYGRIENDRWPGWQKFRQSELECSRSFENSLNYAMHHRMTEGRLVWAREIDYTNFPFEKFDLFAGLNTIQTGLVDGVGHEVHPTLYLPSEH